MVMLVIAVWGIGDTDTSVRTRTNIAEENGMQMLRSVVLVSVHPKAVFSSLKWEG